MTETAEISTPTTDVQNVDTSNAVTPTENVDTVTDEPTEQKDVAENEQDKENEQQPEKLYAGKYKTVEELEKGYKESEKSINRVAELEKEIQTLRGQVPAQPQIVNEQGQVNPQFERAFYHDLNSQEFGAYQQYAMQLENQEQRMEALDKLNEANRFYSNGNLNAYQACMDEVKEYFHPRVIEAINAQKLQMQANKNTYINQAIQQQRATAGKNFEAELRQNPEVFELVDPDSPNYNEDVFGVVKEYFDVFGGLDVNRLTTFIKAIESNGVRKHQANLEAQKTAAMNKSKAAIQNGDTVDLGGENIPTYEQISKMSQEEYNKAYKKWGNKLLTAQ